MSETLIVIPVRAGSVGIPNKAMRRLAEQSPLYRTLDTANHITTHVVVATNDDVVQSSVQNLGYPVARLSDELACGDAPLDAAVHFATEYMERRTYPATYDVVVTLQCTSPFTTVDTIQKCIAIAQGDCTALTVRDDRGLRWESAKIDSPMIANRAPRRVTRQKMPSVWRETGAVFATPRRAVEPTSRFAHVVQLVEVSGREAVDLDTPEDWAIAEMYAGATERETLTARVLSDRPSEGHAFILSAYREGEVEERERALMGAQFTNVTHIQGANTHDEARTVLGLWRSDRNIVIVTSAYHMPRAFLTFLQVLKDKGLERTVRLWCAPAPSGMQKLSGEYAKINEYQAKGDCARYDEGLEYLNWRDSLKWTEAYACVA